MPRAIDKSLSDVGVGADGARHFLTSLTRGGGGHLPDLVSLVMYSVSTVLERLNLLAVPPFEGIGAWESPGNFSIESGWGGGGFR